MIPMTIRAFGAALAAGVLLVGVAQAADAPAAKGKDAAKPAATAAADEVAVLETSQGRMVVEFWPKDAPETVANFKKLARQGFYDGTGFHRIIQNFMIQGGDPNSKDPKSAMLGMGDPGYKIKDEFNARKHVKGVLSMAHSAAPNSAGSQFFIMHGTAPHLDGQYTAFGRVMEGMDVLDKIAATPVEPNQSMGGEMSKPKTWTAVKSVKILPKAALAGQAKAAGVKQTGQTKAADAKTAGQAKAADAKAGTAEKAAGAIKAGMGQPQGGTPETGTAVADSAAPAGGATK